MTPRLSYMICTNPRTGSWLLAEGLAGTGLVGNPREWLSDFAERKWCELLGIPAPEGAESYHQYLQRVIDTTTTANGIFGVKCLYEHLTGLPARINPDGANDAQALSGLVNSLFPNLRFIRMVRRDRVRQAISYYRAVKSDVWWNVENAGANAIAADIPYDPAAIARMERLLEQKDIGWQHFFTACKQDPLVLYYEDFADAYEKTIRHVLREFGVEGTELLNIPPPRLKKQADHSVEDWVKRYREYQRGGSSATADAYGAATNEITPPAHITEHELQLLRKRESLAVIRRTLSGLDPNTRTIERRAFVSRTEFLEKYYAANRPVILTGMMENWAARTRWTPEYLKQTCGEETVEIMAGRNRDALYEIDAQKHKKTMYFADYVDRVRGGGETNDYYLVARNNFFARPATKLLLADMEILPEYLKQDTGGDGIFMWYGPKGTVTPMHQDLLNIFMAQVQGRKRIRLIPSADLDCIYNHTGVYSQIDPENPDYGRFPKYRDATVIDFELAAGEVLFIPVGWWHHVRALDTSITVSFTNFIFPNKYEWVHPQQGQMKPQAPAYEQAQPQTMGKVLDKSWSDWVMLNLNRECHPEGILKILLENNFSVSDIRTAMGERFPSHSPLLSNPHPALKNVTPGIDHRAVAQVRLTHSKKAERIDDPRLQLYLIKDFLSKKECNDMVKVIGRSKLRPSTVTYGTSNFRTSKTSDLSHMNDTVIAHIDEKISAMLGINLAYAEGTQAQKYVAGELFKAHTDYFEPDTEEFEKFGGPRGNRTWTFMIYLNDTPKGGGTQFVNLGKTFYPRKGWALAWNNLYPDGRPNPDTMHYGMPVEEGEKIIITKWFRERGSGEMFRREDAALKQLAFA